MDVKFDISKFFEMSARVSFAIAAACAIVLFFPEKLLYFDITSFREKHGIWIFIVMAIAGSIFASYLIQWFLKLLKSSYNVYKTWKMYKEILSNLSDSEKHILKTKYDKNDNTITVDLENKEHMHMRTLGVISLSSGTIVGHPNGFPGFIQPWVFEIIKKNPDILETAKRN